MAPDRGLSLLLNTLPCTVLSLFCGGAAARAISGTARKTTSMERMASFFIRYSSSSSFPEGSSPSSSYSSSTLTISSGSVVMTSNSVPHSSQTTTSPSSTSSASKSSRLSHSGQIGIIPPRRWGLKTQDDFFHVEENWAARQAGFRQKMHFH